MTNPTPSPISAELQAAIAAFANLATFEVTLRRDNLLATIPHAVDAQHRQELEESAARMTAEITRRAGT